MFIPRKELRRVVGLCSFLPYRFYLHTQARIHTGFHHFTEIGHIFHNKYNFDYKNTSKVGIWPVSCLNDYEIQERGL